MCMRSILLSILCFLMAFLHLHSQETSSLSGIISDSLSKETLIGVTVRITKDGVTKRGAYTNKFGFYSLPNIPSGTYTLLISSVGYESKSFQVNISNQDIRLDISMKQSAKRTQEVTVSANREEKASQYTNTMTLSTEFLKQMPAIGGEVDVFRVLQLMPGVKSVGELSSGLYVRGGSPDQNLTLLDGVIVYNPSHLGGFLSTFNSDALKDINLLKGGFPAEYGGRLSSVLDMTMREGTKEKITGKGGISLIASRLTVEGPINEQSSFMISGRRMYLDAITALASSEVRENSPTYYFYDLNAKVNYQLGENDRLFISGYFGRDVLNEPESAKDQGSVFNIDWGNSTFNSRWMHIFSPKVFTNFSLIYTDYQFGTEIGQSSSGSGGSSTTFFSSFSKIRDFMMRGDMQYFAGEDHVVKVGFEAINHQFYSNATDSIGSSFNDLVLRTRSRDALEAAFYAQDEWKLTNALSMNIGSRVYYFQNGNYLAFEPRMSGRFTVSDGWNVNASFARAHQFLHLIIRNNIALPTDLWFPSTETIKPSMSDQMTGGIEYISNDQVWRFTADAYYKKMSNLYEYKDTASFALGLPLEDQFTSGRGESYGMELFLNKRIGNLTGWLGYTLSWTTRTFAELNQGRTFYPRYDRRHDLSLALTYKLGESWELGATWVYGTGQAFTMPTGKYVVRDFTYFGFSGWTRYAYDYSQRNGYRLPAFHKLDLNFAHTFTWFGLPMVFNINIYNAYNRLNPFAQYVVNEYDSSTGKSKPVVKQLTLFPFLPTIGLQFSF
ncbi:MAG: TonB-dependent receptor [Ignavibacteria bacterium]|nr:TonB-dependent receptor [Ignavibacteria bacterium]